MLRILGILPCRPRADKPRRPALLTPIEQVVGKSNLSEAREMIFQQALVNAGHLFVKETDGAVQLGLDRLFRRHSGFDFLTRSGIIAEIICTDIISQMDHALRKGNFDILLTKSPVDGKSQFTRDPKPIIHISRVAAKLEVETTCSKILHEPGSLPLLERVLLLQYTQIPELKYRGSEHAGWDFLDDCR